MARGLSFLQVQNAIFESLAIKTKTGFSLDKSIKLKWKGMKDEINRNQSTFVYVYKEPHYIIVLLTVIEDPHLTVIEDPHKLITI